MVKLRMDFPANPITEFRFDSIIDLKRTKIRDDLLVSPISAMFHFYYYNLVITLEAI